MRPTTTLATTLDATSDQNAITHVNLFHWPYAIAKVEGIIDRRKPATKGNRLTRKPLDPWLSHQDVLSLLRVPRSTLSKWRSEGKFPEMTRLPSGELRIQESVLNAWLDSLPRV